MPHSAGSAPQQAAERLAPARPGARSESRPPSLDPLVLALGQAARRAQAAARDGAGPAGRQG
ncbi:hypothetical protein [Rhodobacter calidifons]|uniref:Uncharacterized protein n=1 Tax=Rhodobacter calidifons TaxID=2715277 RepID=A0ABX0G9J6_9RHOB|nr:hypothetical protein [Rhodobacter calidifons]NHB77921.1 hypothetical protein [Rhodobacter calidifons]